VDFENIKEVKEKIIDAEEEVKSILRKIEGLQNLKVKNEEIEEAKEIQNIYKRFSIIYERLKALPKGSPDWTAYEKAKGAKGQAEDFKRALQGVQREINLMLQESENKIDRHLAEITNHLLQLEQMIDDYRKFIR